MSIDILFVILYTIFAEIGKETLFITFGAIFILAVWTFLYFDNKKIDQEADKVSKAFKAMHRASQYAKSGTPEHAKKAAELFNDN